MRKKIFKIIMATAFLSSAVCGCQKAPESSANGGILHAKDSTENEVADIVESAGTQAGIDRDMEDIDCLIGTKENGIRIETPAPYIPENVYHMVLKENSALNMELLEAFLESDSGKIRDLSKKRQKEAEQIEKENENSPERAVYSVFGDGSIFVATDGEKEAGFMNRTAGYFEDASLMEKCHSIYKSGTETILNGTDGEAAESKDFLVKKAEKLLLHKLSKIGMTEIDIYEITMWQSEDFIFYEMMFTPSYDGMGSVHEFGSDSLDVMYQTGSAWVCSDGVASVELFACLGEVEQKELCDDLLSWQQVEEIIEINLNNGKIRGSSKVTMTEVEFLYYPLFDENKNKVEMVPVWRIYIPMSEWIENDELSAEIEDAVWSICVNAVSGEIVRVQ